MEFLSLSGFSNVAGDLGTIEDLLLISYWPEPNSTETIGICRGMAVCTRDTMVLIAAVSTSMEPHRSYLEANVSNPFLGICHGWNATLVETGLMDRPVDRIAIVEKQVPQLPVVGHRTAIGCKLSITKIAIEYYMEIPVPLHAPRFSVTALDEASGEGLMFKSTNDSRLLITYLSDEGKTLRNGNMR